jgi:hypothetical protein
MTKGLAAVLALLLAASSKGQPLGRPHLSPDSESHERHVLFALPL